MIKIHCLQCVEINILHLLNAIDELLLVYIPELFIISRAKFGRFRSLRIRFTLLFSALRGVWRRF